MYVNTTEVTNSQTAGGGVLITVALLHLIPELSEADAQTGFDFPIMYFVVLLGYMTLLLLEKVQRALYVSDA
jgi:hypothetical protein